jgi:hypothetical protein
MKVLGIAVVAISVLTLLAAIIVALERREQDAEDDDDIFLGVG